MEKHEITLSFDRERMDALAFYLKKEDTTVQRKMDEALRLLYEETVPEPVREYLDARNASMVRPKRPPRSGQPKKDPPDPSAPRLAGVHDTGEQLPCSPSLG